TPTVTPALTPTATVDATPTPIDIEPKGTPDGTGESTPEVVETGAVTNQVWTCPQGFVLDAAGADPRAECSTVTDGVTFLLDGPDGRSEGVTGEVIPGAAAFG